MKLFNRRKKAEIVRQTSGPPAISSAERQALEWPGTTGGLPYSAYKLMLSDAMIQTAIRIKKLAVLAAPWRIVPFDDSPESKDRAQFVKMAFGQMVGSPHSLMMQAMDAFAFGWSIQEIQWRSSGDQILIGAVRGRDPSLFGMELDSFGQISGLTFSGENGESKSLESGHFVVYQYQSDYSRQKGLSDLDSAYGHFTSKQSLMKAWKLHLERFASPTIISRYERGVPLEEVAQIQAALERIHTSTALTIPNDVEVVPLSSQAHENSAFLDALDFHNREIARAILGQTLTTDEGRRVGSLALGKVHLQVLMLQIAAIRNEIADVVMTEQVIRPLIEHNFGPGLIPRLEFDQAPIDAFISGQLG